jgi:hypothetical protein
MTFTGRWGIVEMDLWDLEAIDLVGPGFIEFGGDGAGHLAGLDRQARDRVAAVGFREADPGMDFRDRPQSVQSGSDVSPTPGVWSALTSLPSGSMINRPGAENTMLSPSGDHAGVYARSCVNLRTAEPSGRIT